MSRSVKIAFLTQFFEARIYNILKSEFVTVTLRYYKHWFMKRTVKKSMILVVTEKNGKNKFLVLLKTMSLIVVN